MVATTTEPVLEARDLYRFYHSGDSETLALRGVSLAVARFEFIAVTGPSGSGKSTLLAALAGLDDPDGGAVMVDGRRMTRRSHAERSAIRAESIGMLFQSDNLLEHLDIAQNIAIVQRLVRRRVSQTRPIALLERFGLAHRAHARPSQLSGGELARASLAVALANDPPILLADEPTGELDEAATGVVLEGLTSLAAGGRAVVVVTHSRRVAGVADREIRLRDGKVVV